MKPEEVSDVFGSKLHKVLYLYSIVMNKSAKGSFDKSFQEGKLNADFIYYDCVLQVLLIELVKLVADKSSKTLELEFWRSHFKLGEVPSVIDELVESNLEIIDTLHALRNDYLVHNTKSFTQSSHILLTNKISKANLRILIQSLCKLHLSMEDYLFEKGIIKSKVGFTLDSVQFNVNEENFWT